MMFFIIFLENFSLYLSFKDSTDKARKYLEGLDGVKFNEIQVPDQLKKQLEYFDRDVIILTLFKL